MWRYVKLYGILQAANIKSRSAYPFNFFIGVFSVTLMGIATIFFTWIITRQVPTIVGYNLYELVFLVSLWKLPHSIFIITFQQIWNIDYLIRDGFFDRYLVRPLNPLFQFFATRFQIAGIGDLIAALVGLIYSASHITDWTGPKLLLLLIIVICGVVMEWSIYTLVGCTAFWTLQGSGLQSIILMLFDQFTRFPLTVYNRVIQIVLTFLVPIAFINFYPSYLFFDNKEQVPFSPLLIYLTPVIALLMLAFTVWVWHKAINHYKGAGS
ncbi:ABC transporter permease [Paenibacillus sp. J2TS4]|uniref:ABC transporter permease n=1 Tax=Paenibacillus sp. J2TS4 TaxID=2807194 RepID=UPI001B121C9E|nr:ABC-2 family transporter protein [Paenibacillus sp. J2TS4]GIP36006.1 ABC transporter permease [Paenibacillus sp. J2TS4]